MGHYVLAQNLATREWATYEPLDWVEAHRELIAEALQIHRRTVGGSLGLTGTRAEGRATVQDAAGAVVADMVWQTLTDAELVAAGVSPRMD
jgi:hypothetical protein